MAAYQPGDIVWRRGTIGAKREPFEHPVVIMSVNSHETIGGQTLYTCSPITRNPEGRAGSIPFFAGGADTKYANLSKTLISGESTFQTPPGGGSPLIGRLSPEELSKLRAGIDAVMVPSSAHLGKIFYSATPSHDGVRGKTHRPYAVIGEIGRGSGSYLAVPVSSSPGVAGFGFKIENLSSAGLVRDEGEDSYTRFAWMATIDGRTSSHEAGRLSDRDRSALYQTFVAVKKMLMAGELRPIESGPDKGANQKNNSRTPLFPGGLAVAGNRPLSGATAERNPPSP